MPDYTKGKIYKIVCGNLTYIGATTRPLCERFAEHKRHSDSRSHFLFLNGEPEIVLIENYPCKNKEELNAREHFHIQITECVNYKVGQTDRMPRQMMKGDAELERFIKSCSGNVGMPSQTMKGHACSGKVGMPHQTMEGHAELERFIKSCSGIFTSSELYELYKGWRISNGVGGTIENHIGFGMHIRKLSGVRRYHSNGTHYSIDPGRA